MAGSRRRASLAATVGSWSSAGFLSGTCVIAEKDPQVEQGVQGLGQLGRVSFVASRRGSHGDHEEAPQAVDRARARSGIKMFPFRTERGIFRNMPRTRTSDRDILGRAIEQVTNAASRQLGAQVTLVVPSSAGRADAVVELTAPDATRATLIVEAKSSAPSSGDALAMIEQLSRYIAASGRPAKPVLAAGYLSPAVRELLAQRGVGYADVTGNVRVALDRPALFVRDVGASRDPWRGPGRPAGDLKGVPAARIVRALIDYRPPYGLPELARRSGASVGATYRLIEFLEREALVIRRAAPRGEDETRRRGGSGDVVDVDWRRLLVRWGQEFRAKAPPLRQYLEPRGMGALMDALREEPDDTYVLTGSPAAARFGPSAPARLAVLYAEKPADLAERLSLRETDRGANVLLAPHWMVSCSRDRRSSTAFASPRRARSPPTSSTAPDGNPKRPRR